MKEISKTSETKVGLIFLLKKMSLQYFYLNTHTKIIQKRPMSLKDEKKEVLAQSCMFTLLVLPLNKTELSITALKV